MRVAAASLSFNIERSKEEEMVDAGEEVGD